MKKIALEEHFWTDGFPHTGKLGADVFQPWFLRAIEERFAEFSDLRLAAMDEAEIDISVLSLISPGVQVERDPAKAASEAKRANDFSQPRLRNTRHATPASRICRCRSRSPLPRSWNAACASSASRARDQRPYQWRLS